MPDLPSLITDLRSDDETIRAVAAESLYRLGPDAQPAVVQWVCVWADTSEIAREWVVGALEEIGPPDPAALNELGHLAATQEPDVAYWAITLLGRLGGSAAPAVDALTHALSTHPATSVRQRAAWALGKIGPAASDALGALRSACTSSDVRLARLAARAVPQIDPNT